MHSNPSITSFGVDPQDYDSSLEEREAEIRDEIVEDYLTRGYTVRTTDTVRHWSPSDLVSEACGESQELLRELVKIARNPGACGNHRLHSAALISYDRIGDLIRAYLHTIIDRDEVRI